MNNKNTKTLGSSSNIDISDLIKAATSISELEEVAIDNSKNYEVVDEQDGRLYKSKGVIAEKILLSF